ncbi:MAG: hypothetical protein JWO05_3651 [Gemmatimonadetes bacterium]|nr:hypothetical protein [Gemmatimonadota bacterium]
MLLRRLALACAALPALAIAPRSLAAQAPGNPALAARILALSASLTALRSQLTGGESGPQMISREVATRLDSATRVATTEMKAVFEANGFPGRKMVGAAASSAAARMFNLTREVSFQERVLAAMEKAVAAGDAAPLDLALLTDVTRRNSGRPQVYGTALTMSPTGQIVPLPIQDSAGVDARRKAVGLGPLADSLAAIKPLVLPSGAPMITRPPAS